MFINRVIAAGFAVCLLLVSGGLSFQVPAHDIHHAHHTATTHTSLLCQWACAAGQGLERTVFELLVEPIPFLLIEITAVPQPESTFRLSSVSRGPPLLSV